MVIVCQVHALLNQLPSFQKCKTLSLFLVHHYVQLHLLNVFLFKNVCHEAIILLLDADQFVDEPWW